MTSKNFIRNIGIVAHVDAGKTTLTEQLLFTSGSSRILGSVDKGTTHTDSMEIEKQRGISVRAAEIDLTWKDIHIFLLDTPGHVDFSAEVERSIGVLDGAIVVISAVEGVQPQTEVYFNALKKLKIPTIFFINKIDRIGADLGKVILNIKKLLTKNIITLQKIDILNDDFNVTSVIHSSGESKETIENSVMEEAISILGDHNDMILEKYYDGKLTPEFICTELQIQAKAAKVYPIFMGTALKGIGIKELLNGIIDYLPAPASADNEELSALVYKISHHKLFGKLSHIKLFSGTIEIRDEVLNISKDTSEKVTNIRKISEQKEIDVKSASSGELVMVSGLDCSIGDILGSNSHIPKVPTIATPLLTIKVYSEKEEDYIPLVEALNILQEEDPLLNMEWIKEKKEINIQIMGTIQLEILENILLERFKIQVGFGKPSVIYKETPSTTGYGEERYTMPKPCWAIVKFLIEPLPKGSGIVYESRVRTEKIKQRYQREIENSLLRILSQGIYGWSVTDLKITLIDGEDHVMHSRPGDFQAATAMALMKGFTETNMTLLEPIIDFRISVPEEVGGKLLSDVISMRGVFENPVINEGTFTVEGKLPVATSLEYPITLGIISSGRGVMSTKFSGYQPCPLELGNKRERIGVNPLDRAKFILYVRNAL